eukprot:Polyplicarium_translucidae@DN1032_c0_g1_i3.p1
MNGGPDSPHRVFLLHLEEATLIDRVPPSRCTGSLCVHLPRCGAQRDAVHVGGDWHLVNVKSVPSDGSLIALLFRGRVLWDSRDSLMQEVAAGKWQVTNLRNAADLFWPLPLPHQLRPSAALRSFLKDTDLGIGEIDLGHGGKEHGREFERMALRVLTTPPKERLRALHRNRFRALWDGRRRFTMTEGPEWESSLRATVTPLGAAARRFRHKLLMHEPRPPS